MDILKSDSYFTKDDTPRALFDKLTLNTRFYFVIKFLRKINKSRKLALKGKYDNHTWIKASFGVIELIEKCGGRFHITGMDNFRNLKEPVIFISNHMSTLETLVFPSLIAPSKEVTFVVKDSLIEGNFFGPIMRSCNPIVVSRENTREDLTKVLNEGQELLAKGTSIILFPQSTRKVEFIPEEFNSLGIKLAKKAGVKVIPVAIKTDFWGNGKHLKDLGPINRKEPIHIKFGAPLSIQGSGKEENEKIVKFISSNLAKWNAEKVKK